MQIAQVRIGGQTIALAVDTDVSEVKDRILEAVRAGAGFVDFETSGQRVLSVLVTPAIPVRFELFEVDDDVSELEENSSSMDHFEMFGYADLEA